MQNRELFKESFYKEYPQYSGCRVVYLDCHNFNDPATDQDLVNHIGLHPKILQGIIQNEDYQPHLDCIADEAILALNTELESGFDLGTPLDKDGQPASQQLVDEKSHQLILLCGCRSGRHRSVTMSESLKYALENTEWPNVQLVHLEKCYCSTRGC